MFKIINNQRGASMLEFTIAAILVFGLIGIVFDLGLAIYNYGLLTHTTARSVRKVAAQLSINDFGENCADIKTHTKDVAELYLKETLGASGKFEFIPTILIPSNPPSTLRLEGKWKLTCYFCMLLPNSMVGNINISSTSEAMVENVNFTCS